MNDFSPVPRKEVAFVDTTVANWQELLPKLPSDVEVVKLDVGGDGLAQMAQWAATHSGYDAIHVLSHGAQGMLALGGSHVNAASLSSADVRGELAALGQALNADGDLLLYGCNVAGGVQGAAFIDALAALTGADVAASTDSTGAASIGGNWSLEAHTGIIQAPPLQLMGYSGLLGTITFDDLDVDSYVGDTMTRSDSGHTFTFSGVSGSFIGVDTYTGTDVLYAFTGVVDSISLTVSIDSGYTFDISTLLVASDFNTFADITVTYGNGTQASFTQAVPLNGKATLTGLASTIDDVKEVVFTANKYMAFNDFVITDIKAIPSPATVTATNIVYTSTGSGTGGAYKIGDTVIVTWDNAGSGDNNSGLTGVTMNFSQFGGGAAVTATNNGEVWSASYTIVAGSIDLAGRHVQVNATNGGGTTTLADITGQVVDNVAPTVTDANISLSGASGTSGAFKAGDTVTATWNNTAGGDNNTDTISNVTVDFSQFGGGSAVAASNSSGTWTATYTITSGAIDATSRNVSFTATDNAGNTTTRADTSNATVDSIAPTVTDARIAISGGTGTSGAYKIGDTVTVTWNNTAGGDNNSDTISGVTVDFSQFGGGAAVAATNSSGTWTATYTITAGAISNSNRNVSVTASDNAGNSTTRADTSNATVDNAAPVITFSALALSADSGTAGDFITATAAQTITATLSTTLGGGELVMASLDNGSTWTDVTSQVSGTSLSWSTTLGASSTLKLKVTDGAGNDGVVLSQAYVLDASAPSAPSAADLSTGSDSGVSSTDNITSDNTPTLTGTAESGATVTLYDTDGTTVLGTTTATGGTWSITTSALSNGNHTLTTKATDAAGNVSTASSGLVVGVDTAAPTAVGLSTSTVVAAAAGSGATVATLQATDTHTVTYALATGNGTNDADNASFTISGSNLVVGGSSLAAGTYHLYLAATDAAGNVSNQAVTFTVVNVPSVTSIVRVGSAAVAGSAASADYTVTFSESVTGVDVSDFDLTHTGTAAGSISGISGSGTTYTVTVNSLAGDGTLRLDLNGSGTGIQNGSSIAIASGYTSGQTYTLDHTAPVAPSTPDLHAGSDSGSSSSDDLTNDNTPTLIGTAESGSTVTLYDTNGTTVLGTTTATGGNWSITASTLAVGSHTLTAKATDAAGNVSSASAGLSVEIDTTAPTGLGLSALTIAVAAAGSGANVATLLATDSHAITYSLATGSSGNDADNGAFTISGSTLQVGGAALSAGSYSIFLAATDAAGNVTSQAFTVNAVNAPSVSSIVRVGSAAVAGSASSVDYTVTFSESVTGVDVSDFDLTKGSTAAGSISGISGSGTTYTVTVNSLAGDGTLRLDLNGSSTGIQNGSSVAIAGGYISGQTYTLDHTAPVVTSINRVSGASINGATASYTVTFGESVTGVDAADFLLTAGGTAAGTITSVTGSGTTYTVNVGSITGDGTLQLDLKSTGTGIADAAINAAAGYTSGQSYTVDHTAPLVNSIARVGNANTNAASVSYTVTFAESVTGVDVSDFILTGTGGASGTIASIVGSGTTYTVTVNSAAGEGTLRLDLNGSGTGIADAAGNGIAAGFTGGDAVTLDHTAPTLAIASSSATLAVGETANITFTFSEDPGGSFVLGDISASGGTMSSLAGSGNVRTAVFTATTQGTGSVSVAASAYTDLAGNNGTGDTAPALTINAAPPSNPGGGNNGTVDGVPVSTTTATDPQSGLPVQTISVPTIVPGRQDDPNTPNATLADIPLGAGSSNGPHTNLTVSLPVGMGLSAQGPSTLLDNAQALLDLIQRIESRTTSGSSTQLDMTGQGEGFLDVLGSNVMLQTATVILQSGSAATLTLDGNPGSQAGAGSGKAIGLVVDASQLAAGSVLNLDNVEFAAVVGALTMRGGAGSNHVVGDGASQNIVLGAEDDIISGGGGNDFIGSRAGNDKLDGGADDDLVAGGEGNDTLLGGSGNDILQGGRSDTGDWRFHLTGSGALSAAHTDAVLATGMQETVQRAELNAAADSLAFMSLDSQRLIDVSLLYGAFDRVADLDGLAFWAKAPLSISAVAEGLLQSAEWRTANGTQDDAAFLASIYQHVLGRTADADGLAFWGAALARGVSRAEVLTEIALSTENRAQENGAQGYAIGEGSVAREGGWFASSGDDRLDGGAGDDILAGGDGNDTLIGGDGRDTAVFTARQSDYRLLYAADGQVRMQDKAGGELDTLSGIEVAAFSNGSLELDFLAAPAAQLKAVGLLYGSVLDRPAELDGLRFWLASGLDATGLAAGFAGSAEFQARYGAMSNAAFVQALYDNSGLAANAAGGAASWQDYLAGHTRAELLGAWIANADVQLAQFGGNGLWLL
jgi:hypothetical protein